MNTNTFVYSTIIKTTPEKLWEALTTSDFTEKYWGSDGRKLETDWKVGSPVRTIRPDGKTDWQGKVLQCDPPKLLSFTFEVIPSEPVSTVTYVIEPQKSGTKLTVTHIDLSEVMLSKISGGWTYVLSSLKSLLETGIALQ
jgi:uncharacterized protein YndB with AHSA1/START domain